MAAYEHTNSKGVTYFLHSKDVTLRGGKNQTIYFFAKALGGKGEPSDLPKGYEVTENPRNGFLTIRKIRPVEA
ncbi:hypothetical protein H7Y40_00470 [Pedobacter sp.]|nr:hypothetical protein [Candidatus Saccharibacteria bacterium]